MTSSRYPWRIVAIAAISLIGNAFLGYYMLFGLASEGVSLDEQSGWVVVTDVGEQTAGARAGIQPGDKILDVNGQQIATVVDWLAQRMNFEAGRPVTIRLQRGEKTLDLTMVIHGRIWGQWTNSLRTSNVIFLGYKLITLTIGLFVVFSRPRDRVARLGGWVLVVMATVFEAFQWGLSSATRSLPLFVAIPVMLVYVSAAFRTPLLAAFFCLYPKRLFVNRWLWAGFCVGPIVATIYALYLFGRTVYDPEHLTALTPPWVLLVFGVQSLVYLGAVLVALPVSYLKLETVTDRRRFRVLVFGALVAMVFYLPRVIGTALINLSPWFYEFYESPYVYMACTLGMLIFPMAFAYAILKQRLFDLRVIIRRGVQYALARRVLLAIPLVAIGLLVGTVLAQGRQPLFSVLKTHAWSYVAIAALAALASTQRQKWLSALDRRFFRDKYDAQQLFREIVEDIRRAENVEEVAQQVVGRVADALHTQGCGLLVRKPGESVVSHRGRGTARLALDGFARNEQINPAGANAGVPGADYAGGNGLGGAATSASGQGFPAEGAHRVAGAGGAERGKHGSVAGAGRKAVRGAVQPGRHGAAGKRGGRIGAVADARERPCTQGGRLRSVPRAERVTTRERRDARKKAQRWCWWRLRGCWRTRYRLEKRLGHGGMGKVYRATDMSLNREVAVKMIRDEFFADQKAIEKFRQESQVTGSFAHPNVVTVYDFGVEAGQRVFLVMELLEGITLRQELRASKRLDAVRTLELFEGICAGVEAAHARGLIHRDLKPENIFLSQQGWEGVRENNRLRDREVAAANR